MTNPSLNVGKTLDTAPVFVSFGASGPPLAAFVADEGSFGGRLTLVNTLNGAVVFTRVYASSLGSPVAAPFSTFPEVLVFTELNRLHAVVNSSGEEMPGWPLTLGSQSVQLFLPAMGDITGDGVNEVVVAATDGQLHALDAFGIPLPGWPRVFGNGAAEGGASLADINGDGVADVVAAVDVRQDMVSYRRVLAIQGTGQVLPGWDTSPLLSAARSPLAAGDFDRDGNADVAFTCVRTPSQKAALYLLDKNGALVPGFPVEPVTSGPQILGALAVGDVRGDGISSLVFTSPAQLFVLALDGTAVPGFPLALSSEITPTAPALVDLDGMGGMDILAASNGALHGITGAGAELPGWPLQVGQTPLMGYPAVGRYDATRSVVAVGDYSGRGRIWLLGQGSWSRDGAWTRLKANAAGTGAAP